MYEKNMEISQAIDATDNALMHLNAAKDSINKAKNWGIFDLLGGGMFSTMIKRDNMRNAQIQVDDAKRALEKLNDELKDIKELEGISTTNSDFVHFADYFFDGLIVDWVVQKNINEIATQIQQAINKVESIRSKLLAMI